MMIATPQMYSEKLRCEKVNEYAQIVIIAAGHLLNLHHEKGPGYIVKH